MKHNYQILNHKNDNSKHNNKHNMSITMMWIMYFVNNGYLRLNEARNGLLVRPKTLLYKVYETIEY